MDKLTIKYSTYGKAIPPQPIRIKTPGWGGAAEKMEDGSDGQPWHCLPFVEATTYGLELIYQYETTCQVVNDQGNIRFEWDFASEPGGALTGGEFLTFSPRRAAKYYLFTATMDLQAPPGHVARSEPHPRFFTDDTGTVPLAMTGHVQSEWYPKLLFVVFRAPPPGQRHIFRKGEPYAQILFVPQRPNYELIRMTPEEEAQRRELERAILVSRQQVSENIWKNSDGAELDNHYKVLARTFAEGGSKAVDQLIHGAAERHEVTLRDKTIPECLALGSQHMSERKYRQAMGIYNNVLARDPQCAEALSNLGICLVCLGNMNGLELMAQAVAVQPRLPRYHSNLGEMLRLVNRFQEAEAEFRLYLQLNPTDPGIWSVLGLTLAQQGRPAEGLQACRTALAIAPPIPVVHFRMGLIFAQQRQSGEARACYEAALQLDPGFADARRALQDLPG